MPSGWDVYYVIFLSAAVALGIPGVLGIVSALSFPGSRRKRERPSSELDVQPAPTSSVGKRVNVRFFLATNAAVALIGLGLAIIPCIGAIHAADGVSRQEIARALFSIVSIAGLATLGLLYAARKGDLSWLRAFQRKDG